MRQIDDATVMYSAKLIGIKDAFSKVQDKYVEEIEALYKSVSESNKKIDEILSPAKENVRRISEETSLLRQHIEKIDIHKLERTDDPQHPTEPSEIRRVVPPRR